MKIFCHCFLRDVWRIQGLFFQIAHAIKPFLELEILFQI